MANIKKSITVTVAGLKDFVTGSKEVEKYLNEAKQAVNDITEEIQKATEELGKSDPKVAALKKRLEEANKEVQSIEKNGKRVVEAFSKFVEASDALYEGVEAGKEIWAVFSDEAKTTGEKVSESADIASEALSEMGAYGAVAALAVQGLAAVWSMFNQEAEEAAQIQREVDNATDEVVKSVLEEYNALIDLEKTLNDTNASYTERNAALEEIQSKYGQYIGNIKLETLSLSEQTGVLSLLKNRLIEVQIQRGIEAAQAEQLSKQLKARIDLKIAEADGDREAARIARKDIRDSQKAYNLLGKEVENLTKLTKEALGVTMGFGEFAASIRVNAADVAQEIQRRAEKARQAAEDQAKIAADLEQKRLEAIRKQLEIIKLMARISQQRQAGIQGALEAGDFDAAQKLLDTDKQAWELEKERLRTQSLNNNITLEQIKNKQEELIVTKQLAKAQEEALTAQRNAAAEAIKQRVITDMQAGDIKTILGAQLFQGIEIPEEFKSSLGPNLVTVFKDATGRRTQEQLDQVLAEAFKTADPLKYLRERGVSSVFDAIDKRNNETFKRNADNIKKQENELKALEEKYQKQESEGKRDIDAEDRERQKEFTKRQKEIDKARKDFNERVQKAEEEAAKRLSELSKALNDLSLIHI